MASWGRRIAYAAIASFVAGAAMLSSAAATGSECSTDTECYQYDAYGRLTQVTYTDGSCVKYTYDNAGNLTSTVSETTCS